MMQFHHNRIRCFLLCLLLLPSVGCSRVEQLLASAPRDALVINEVVTSNQLSLQDEIYGSPDWIELYNASDQSVHLSAYYITDNVEAPQKAVQLPDVMLAPGQFYLLYANKKSGNNCLSFSLKKTGETLTILDTHMAEVSSLVVPALLRDVSYARRADGTYGFCDLPTPGAVNTGTIEDNMPLSSQLMKEPEEVVEEQTRSLDILITEIVSKNEASLAVTGCEECTEWVELYNPNDVPVPLTGFTLTDDMSETDRHNFPDVELAPGQYLIVCCGRKACAAEDHVRIDVGLSAKGEVLFLFDSNGFMLDQVTFPALPADVSWAKRTDGSWGYCVDPIPGLRSQDADIVADIGPTSMTDPFSTVHIHEVLCRNGRSILDEDGDRSDFVELYNGGMEPVDLGSWYLGDSADKLTKWALPKITLAPGDYLLVFLSGKDRTGSELHASFSLHAGETLVLYNSASRQYDALLIPETAENVSIGRDASGKTVFYSHPTPLEENGNPLPTGK